MIRNPADRANICICITSTSFKGGPKGYFRGGKNGVVEMVVLMFAVVSGISYPHLAPMGINISKNTWTSYVKVYEFLSGYITSSFYISIYLSLYLSLYLSIYISIYLSIYLSIYHNKIFVKLT